MNNEIIKTEEKKEKKVIISVKVKEIIFDIFIFITLIVFSLYICPKTLQNDTFYTIKCGEDVFTNGISNLTEDKFSWLDLPYTYPHWLYDLMIFVIYNHFGMDGIYASTVAFATILGWAVYKLACLKSGNKFRIRNISFFCNVFNATVYCCKGTISNFYFICS